MSAKWQWGTVNIYVSEDDISQEVKRAELFKLDAIASTWHYFGAGSSKARIRGLVIGSADRAQIASDAVNNVARSFVGPWGTLSNAFINGAPSFKAVMYSGATIDGTTYNVETTPIYEVELEITT